MKILEAYSAIFPSRKGEGTKGWGLVASSPSPPFPSRLRRGVNSVGDNSMTLRVLVVNHVNVTVPAAFGTGCQAIHGEVLGLRQIPNLMVHGKTSARGMRLEACSFICRLQTVSTTAKSDRHVCYEVEDLGARSSFP